MGQRDVTRERLNCYCWLWGWGREVASQGLRQPPEGRDSLQVTAGKRMGTRSLHCKEVDSANKQSKRETQCPLQPPAGTFCWHRDFSPVRSTPEFCCTELKDNKFVVICYGIKRKTNTILCIYRFNFWIEFYFDREKSPYGITIRFSLAPLTSPQRSLDSLLFEPWDSHPGPFLLASAGKMRHNIWEELKSFERIALPNHPTTQANSSSLDPMAQILLASRKAPTGPVPKNIGKSGGIGEGKQTRHHLFQTQVTE